jgi:large subunit ribosomal protein L23
MDSIVFPRMTEKAFAQAKNNVYIFNVSKKANKITVKKAVETQFGVKVSEVNICTTKGKAIRSIRKNGKRINGVRSDYKKAYVTVAQGDSIPVFAATSQEEK